MPRVALTPVAVNPETRTAVVLASVGAAVNAGVGEGHSINPPNGVMPEELMLWVSHTTASSKNVTVKAGVNPPSESSVRGDLVTAFGAGDATTVNGLIPLSSRFLQADGNINVDVEAATTGRIAVLYVPRTA